MDIRRGFSVAALATSLVVVFSITGSAASQASPQEQAQQILDSPAVMTAMARTALQVTASGDQTLSHQTGTVEASGSGSNASSGATAAPAQEQSALRNVRVNDPREDVHQTSQTTHSETSIAAAGRDVVVGFNDSQTTLLALTAGTSLNGYAHSGDGGASFTDGGAIPNRAGCSNFGDPWLASDRTGAIYYSSLALCQTPVMRGVFAGVAKSTDGGRTFASPVIILPPTPTGFYQADKDAMTAGPDPAVRGRDNLYDAWDDFTFGPSGPLSGLPVARSTDGGQHWATVYAAQVPLSAPCPGTRFGSFTQFIGAMPIVDPAGGKLFVAAEKLHQPCPASGGPPPSLQRSEVIYASADGGLHFGPEAKIADVTQSFANGVLMLGPGRAMRNLEFPTLAVLHGDLFAAWNDGRTGHSHVLLSKSGNGGASWAAPVSVTAGSRDELQPAMSGDGAGLHVLYYQHNAGDTLDVRVANSEDGTSFPSRRVSSESFPGVFNLPQFDPIVASAYMGDYIANISAGSNQLFAWGDNRDVITDFLFPAGRNNPDVFFALQGREES
jgi:hypothetical protein